MIYLDHNATTPVDPQVVDVMLPYLRERFGNPSSGHACGRRARAAVDAARAQVAALLGCAPDEILFTSGGSEADNHAIRGMVEAAGGAPCHLVTCCIEHPAVLQTCRYLERHGVEVTCLPVDRFGQVDPQAVRAATTDATALITLMHANNEVGTLQPIAEVAAIARARGIPFHTDAAQSVGKVPVRVDELGVDLLTVAGHKLYAPQGIGALYVRRGTPLPPLIHGAGHEGGRRAGTENVPGIVALGEACALAQARLEAFARDVGSLRDRLHRLLEADPGGVHLNGHPHRRLPNTVSLSFEGIEGAQLTARLEGVAVSTGSACHAGVPEPSPTLLAMGVPRGLALGAVRFSLGKDTTQAEIEAAAREVAEKVAGLRPS